MKRLEPSRGLLNAPSLVTAVVCGLTTGVRGIPKLNNGWASLYDADQWISENYTVKYVIDYRRGYRPLLEQFHLEGRAILCVTCNFIFYESDRYWAFTDLEDHQVIRAWIVE